MVATRYTLDILLPHTLPTRTPHTTSRTRAPLPLRCHCRLRLPAAHAAHLLPFTAHACLALRTSAHHTHYHVYLLRFGSAVGVVATPLRVHGRFARLHTVHYLPHTGSGYHCTFSLIYRYARTATTLHLHFYGYICSLRSRYVDLSYYVVPVIYTHTTYFVTTYSPACRIPVPLHRCSFVVTLHAAVAPHDPTARLIYLICWFTTFAHTAVTFTVTLPV